MMVPPPCFKARLGVHSPFPLPRCDLETLVSIIFCIDLSSLLYSPQWADEKRFQQTKMFPFGSFSPFLRLHTVIFRFLQDAPTESKSSSGFVSTVVSLCLLWTNVQPVIFTTLFITTSLKAVYVFISLSKQLLRKLLALHYRSVCQSHFLCLNVTQVTIRDHFDDIQ